MSERMVNFAVRLPPKEWLEAWRPQTVRLIVPAPFAPRLRDKAAVRIQLSGKPVAATVLGTVVGVHRTDSHPLVELHPEPDSLPAIRMLVAAARGQEVRFLQRPIRYLVKMPVVVEWNGSGVYANTTTISEKGCAVRWAGTRPTVGQSVRLRVGNGARAVDIPGVVCWSSAGGAGSLAGVRFADRGAPIPIWASVLAEALRSGAPQA